MNIAAINLTICQLLILISNLCIKNNISASMIDESSIFIDGMFKLKIDEQTKGIKILFIDIHIYKYDEFIDYKKNRLHYNAIYYCSPRRNMFTLNDCKIEKDIICPQSYVKYDLDLKIFENND